MTDEAGERAAGPRPRPWEGPREELSALVSAMERREWVLCLTLCGNLVGLPTEQTDWENTFLNNQEYLSTVRVLEDVTRLPFILLGPIAVFQKSYLWDVNSESFTGEIGCLVFALKYS